MLVVGSSERASAGWVGGWKIEGRRTSRIGGIMGAWLMGVIRELVHRYAGGGSKRGEAGATEFPSRNDCMSFPSFVVRGNSVIF